MTDEQITRRATALVMAAGCPANLEADLVEAAAEFQHARQSVERALTSSAPLTIAGAAARVLTAAVAVVRLADDRNRYVWAALEGEVRRHEETEA